MASDTTLESYEHALLLFQYNSPSLPSDELLHSLIVKSDYAGILRRFQHAFTHESRSGSGSDQASGSSSGRLSVEFSDEVTALERLVCAIAALQAFLQTNWTGPEVDLSPSQLLANSSSDSTDNTPSGSSSPSSTNGTHERPPEDAINAAAVEALAMQGEPAYHLTKKAGFLWLAKTILEGQDWSRLDQKLKSVSVWKMRLALVNLRLLDTPVPLGGDLLTDVQVYIESLASTSQGVDIKTSLTLLLGLFHAQYVHLSSAATKQSSETFYSAAKLASLQYELTGRMGKRTKWQIDEKSQLVVLAKSRQRDDGWQPREVMSLQADPEEGNGASDATDEQPKDLLLNDDTLLERTQFTSTSMTSDASASELHDGLSQIDPNAQPVLHPLDQCILLALSLDITNTSPSHGLTTNQIHAFVARVLADGSQNWSIHSMALLLRSRLEANRSRTVERGLLQIQSLVDQLKLESVAEPRAADDLDLEKGATPLERLKYFYTLNSPSVWELERELATRYLGLGVTRSAMEIFTRLEMWEDVAKCYFSLGEGDKAIKVVKDLLDGRLLESEATMAVKRGVTLSNAQKAKLWCLLGDLEKNPAHYQTAWEVSNHTSSRAVRSLGQHFFLSEQYSQAQPCLEKALAINPLFIKVWFVLGCCAMRVEDWPAAERAFRRCVSLDEDDGESWNNLATVLLKETASFSSQTAASEEEREANYNKKRTAYTCLSQAIKFSYDSWRIWVNYLLVSVDVGELMEACRAMARLVELRGDKDGENAIDLDVLDRLVDVAIRENAENKESANAGQNDLQRGLTGRVKSLFEESILPRVSNSSHVYTSYARFLFALGDLRGSLQARLKTYRIDVVLNENVTLDHAEFTRAAERVAETVDFLRNLGSKTMDDSSGELVMKDWKQQARSILRTFLGRTKQSFGEDATWERINEELAEIKALE